jgi:CoA-transferase family III
MAIFMTQQSARNMEYVRKLLKQKQPRFAAALELAVDLAERELSSPELLRDVSAGHLGFVAEARSAGVREGSVGNCLFGGFTRDFATADGERVTVAALTQRQFADLAHTTRLAGTFAFLERLLDADFSACGDLCTYRATIAIPLKPWFARRTVADVAAAFEGTSVPWGVASQPHQSARFRH